MSQAISWRERVCGSAHVSIEGMPMWAVYQYNRLTHDVEEVGIYLEDDAKCETDLADIVWTHYEGVVMAAILNDVRLEYGRV